MTTDNFCFYLQKWLIQTSQTGGQWYSDTSPFSIPWLGIWTNPQLILPHRQRRRKTSFKTPTQDPRPAVRRFCSTERRRKSNRRPFCSTKRPRHFRDRKWGPNQGNCPSTWALPCNKARRQCYKTFFLLHRWFSQQIGSQSYCFHWSGIHKPGNTKKGSITVPLTSCLTGLDQSVLQIKTKIVICHRDDSKPVKQEVNGTVILPPLVLPAQTFIPGMGKIIKWSQKMTQNITEQYEISVFSKTRSILKILFTHHFKICQGQTH